MEYLVVVSGREAIPWLSSCANPVRSMKWNPLEEARQTGKEYTKWFTALNDKRGRVAFQADSTA